MRTLRDEVFCTSSENGQGHIHDQTINACLSQWIDNLKKSMTNHEAQHMSVII